VIDLPEKLQEFLDGLELMEDRQERIETLISTADRFVPANGNLHPKPYPESARVPHCESEAFVFSREQPDGTLKFDFAVENPQGISAMAMAVILDETLSGQSLRRVAAVPEDIVYKIFGNELSMGKSMGLMAMVQMVKAAAKQKISAQESIVSKN
jgi:cysteine desulfuration protein SufE